jgi:hypothetical protein
MRKAVNFTILVHSFLYCDRKTSFTVANYSGAKQFASLKKALSRYWGDFFKAATSH